MKKIYGFKLWECSIDYLFYRACEFYRKNDEDSGFRFSGLIVVSAMHLFNLFSILFTVIIIRHGQLTINKFWTIIVALLVLVLNGIRYNKYDYEMLKEKWSHEEENIRNRKSFWLVTYIVLSTILFFGLAIYIGSKNN